MRRDEEEILIRDDSGLLYDDSVTVSSVRPRPANWCHNVNRTLCLSLAFFVMGMCIAVPGPTLIDLAEKIDTDIPHISAIFSARAVGYLVGAILGGALFSYFDKQLLMFCTLLMVSVATIVVPWCFTLVAMGTLVALQGIGLGILYTGGNIFCVKLWGRKNAPYLQTLHFAFALGAFLAPLLARPFLSNENLFSNTTELQSGQNGSVSKTRNVRSLVYNNKLDYIFSDIEHFDKEIRYRRDTDLDTTTSHSTVINTVPKLSGTTKPADSSVILTPPNIDVPDGNINKNISAENGGLVSNVTQNGTNETVAVVSTTKGPTMKSTTKKATKPLAAVDTHLKEPTADGKHLSNLHMETDENLHHSEESPAKNNDKTTTKTTQKVTESPNMGSSQAASPVSNSVTGNLSGNTGGNQSNQTGSQTVQPLTVPGLVNGNRDLKNESKGSEHIKDQSLLPTLNTGKSLPAEIVKTTSTVARPQPTTTITTTTPKPPPPPTTTTATTTPKPPPPTTTTTTPPKPPPPTTITTTTTTPKPPLPPPTTTTTTTTTTPKPPTTTTTTTTTTTPRPPPPVTTTKKSESPQSTARPSSSVSIPKENDKSTKRTAGASTKAPEGVSKSLTQSPTTELTTKAPKKPATAEDIINNMIGLVKTISKIQFVYAIIGTVAFVSSTVFLICYCRNKKRLTFGKGEDYLEGVTGNTGCFKASVLFMLFLFFICYIGLEVTYGGLVTYFTVGFNHWPKEQGATVTAIFWGAVAVGRGFSIFISRYCRPTFMLAIDLCLMVFAGLVLSVGTYFLTKLLWLGTLILGLGMSSMLPAIISWTETYFATAGIATAVFVMGSVLGEMFLPILTSYLFTIQDEMVLMRLTLALSSVLLVLFIVMSCYASHNGNTYTLRDRNGFLPLQAEDNEDENIEMDLTDINTSLKRRHHRKQAEEEAQVLIPLSDLEED